MYKLTKGSEDSFEITTESLEIIKDTLLCYVCSTCMREEIPDYFWEQPTSLQIEDLIGTPCGAEFIFNDSVENPLTRHWHVQEKLGGYLVHLRVGDFETTSFIGREHWDNHLIPVELLRITIGRLQRQMFDDIFPTFRGRFWCDWDY